MRVQRASKNAETRVYFALVATYREQGRATLRDVAARVGMSLSQTHLAVRQLAEAGLVAWEEGKSGTLRPLYELVRTEVGV